MIGKQFKIKLDFNNKIIRKIDAIRFKITHGLVKITKSN